MEREDLAKEHPFPASVEPAGGEGVLTVKLVDLPDFDTSTTQVSNRLTEFLKGLRLRRLDVEEGARRQRAPCPVEPVLRSRLRGPRYRAWMLDEEEERAEWERRHRRMGRSGPRSPDFACHPGFHLERAISQRGMTTYGLARTMGVSPGRLDEIVRGQRAISPDVSVRLGKALGVAPDYWLDLQREYDRRTHEAPGSSGNWGRGRADIRLSERDLRKIERRASELVRRRQAANGLGHLQEEERRSLKRIYGDVPTVRVPTEHRADEIAAALHEDMPWMAAATKAIWHELRRCADRAEPVKFGPLLLVGQPGTGKTSWARRLGKILEMPSCLIDASRGLASFSVAGVERGWKSAGAGMPLQTVMNARIANPMVIIDEICKSGGLWSSSGVSVAFIPALLGLLEPETARDWVCPYFQVPVDMSHLSWVMTANSTALLPAPLLSRCRMIEIEAPSTEQMQEFARRQAAGMGVSEEGAEVVAGAIRNAARKGAMHGGLRSVIRMLERAEEIERRPVLH